MKKLVLFFLTSVLLLSACSSPETGGAEATFSFFYCTGMRKDTSDEILQAEDVSVDPSQLTLMELMQSYLRGPKKKGLLPAVPEEWKLESAYLDADTAVLVFSDPYPSRSAIESSVARAAIAKTLLQLDKIQKVNITMSGTENSVTLTQTDIMLSDTSLQTQQVGIVLYFPREDGRYLRKETVMVDAMDEAEKPAFILHQLLGAGESKTRAAGIPEGTVLVGVSVENGICTVNLSSRFVSGMESGFMAMRLAVYSIVNSLTELQEIRTVDLWVSGAPLEQLGLLNLSSGLQRDETLIASPEDSETMDATIYPAVESSGELVPIQRMIPVPVNKPVAQTLLETLLDFEGADGISSFIPDGTKILSLKIENRVCVADLTREFLDGCLSDRQEMLAVRSVIATLTALDEIDSVELLVEGIEPVFRNAALNQVRQSLPSWFAE